MPENVDLDVVKSKIKTLTEKIITQNSKASISISDNTAVKIGLNKNTASIKNNIDAIVYGKGSSFEDAIIKARTTFTSQNSDKYIILVTDATDSLKEQLDSLVDNDVTIISILYDITNNELGTLAESAYGPVYMVNDLDEQKLADVINKSLIDLQVKNKLTDEILSYFDIELLTEDENISINEEGILWNIERIKNGETLTIKYKLKLKEDAVIDRNVIFKNWFSAKEVTINYEKDLLQKQVKLEKEKTPIFTVCETYKMKIKAVNSENASLGVAGIQFKIEGKDSEGNTVYTDTLTTDANGYVEVQKIKTLGKVTYTITPIIDIVGYENTEARNVIVDNDYLGRRVIEVDGDGLKAEADSIDRIVEIEFPIKVQGFDLEINLNELNNSNVKLSNAEFRLIQPKLNSKYEMDVLYGKTNEHGQLFFHPAVMTKAGTYDYILSQISEVTGYESMGNVTLSLTFNNKGEITKAVKKHNDNVEITDWNKAYVQLNVGNKGVFTDAFDFEFNLTDKQTGDPIVGAKYDITVTTSNNTKYSFGDNVTDNNGQIKLLLPGTGEVHIAIVEKAPATGYAKCSVAKEFTIHRQDGEVKYAYGSNSSSTNYFNVTCQSVDDKVIVDTEATLKTERNTVKIKAIDAVEVPSFGLEEVQFTLVNTVNGKTYGPAETNYDGEVEFTIDDEPQGQYEYSLITTYVPFGYIKNTDPIRFNIHFDENGYIDSVNDIDTIQKIEYQLVEDETAKLHRAYLEIGIDMEANLAYNFQIALTDIDTGVAIDGAIYDLEIEYGDRIKKIKGRPTDANGMISTRIAVDKSKVTNLNVTVAQTGAKLGYKADLPAQEISINLLNNEITHTPTEVKPGNTQGGQLRYADVSGQTITYHHTNRRKDASDTMLNINVTTLEKTSDSVIGGKSVQIINNAVKDANGKIIKAILDSNGQDLNVTNVTSTDVPTVGYTSFDNLQLIGCKIPGEQEYEIEMIVDGNLIRCRLTYKYNEYTEMVELINVETVWGNRLIRSKNFSSYENETGYISDINLEIYTFEGSNVTGNLTLDLKKADLETKATLAGAKYDIIIERPDGTKIVRSNVEVFDDVVELEGIYVPQDTAIYITEKTAPIGYELNDTMILKVTGVDPYTNEVTLTKENDSYNGERSELVKDQNINISTSGMVQSQYTLNMYDVQMDKFRFKITANDNVTFKGASGFKFEIKNDVGAQKVTGVTNENGEVNTLVGGIYDDTSSPRTYTVTGIKAGTYYKKLATPIEVKVYFKADGTVDYDKTLKGQTDANYSEAGTALGQWHFEGANKLDDAGNIVYCIAIIINVETLDPLNVEIETVNKFTDAVVSDVEYSISPSVTPAKGTTNIQVSYAESNINRSYVLSQTVVPDNYILAKNLGFNITYDDDGNIAEQPVVISPDMKVVSYSGKTLKIQVKIEPRVPITVTNLYYFNHDEVLQGGEFKVTGMKSSLQTNSDGQAKGVIGRFGENEDVTYTVTQTKAKYGYAEVDPFDIVVHYGENREITSVTLAEPNNRFVTVGYIQPSKASDYGYNKTDKGIITLTVLNYKAVTMNIKNVDRQDGANLLSGTQYSVTSDINTKGNGTTDANGMALTYVGKSGFDRTVRYTIHEDKPAFGYQTFGTDIYLDVDFNEDGYITGCAITNNPNIDNVAKASTITPIVTIEDNFTINIELKNNPLMKFNITKVDMQNKERVIKNVTFDVIGTLADTQYTKDTVTTNQEGKVTAKVDRTLDSTTMQYTLKETKKSPFYEWLPEDIKLEISYDETGKMQKGENAYRVIAGNEYIDITNVDEDNFTMDMTIYNDEIKAFGVHIYTDDKYDDSKKVEQATWDAFLTDREKTGHVKDNNYSARLISGRDSDGDGNPDLAHAEDYQIIGEYSGGTGTRTLRLTTSSGWMPNTYSYNDEWIRSAYGLDSYNILIDIDFDDNGKIINQPRLRTGDDNYIGWLLDGRYVEVSKEGDYGINVTIHYYPKLQVAMRTYDMYTDEYTPANFQISTISSTGDRNGIKEGYLGYNAGDGRHSTISYKGQAKNSLTIDNFKALCFTETQNARMTRIVDNEDGTNSEQYGRYIYLYEMNEPTSPVQYQKYRPRSFGNYYSRKLAKIIVWYNNKGEVVDSSVEQVYSNNNITDIKVIIPEEGMYAGTYDAEGNFTKYNNHNIYIDVAYAPITTAGITVRDEVSGAPIGEIRVYPYGGGTHQTSTSYEHRTTLHYDTNNNGQTSWTYWGANVAGDKNIYKISLGKIEKGYLGAYSDEGEFRYIEVEVSYNEQGRIGAARVLNKDGFNNVAATVDESCYGTTHLKLNFNLKRKMGMQINKVDQYDNNIKLSAKFKVTNNIDTSGTSTEYMINTGTRKEQLAGRIIANNTVEYTLSEVTVPDGYKPLDKNLKLIVKYRANGTIETAYPADEYSKEHLRVDYVCQSERRDNSLLYKDIEITVYNEPKFAVELELVDKYYNNIKIDNVTFNMTSSEGDVAVGNLVTDAYGKIYTYIGAVHPGKTVTYTLEQADKASGYYKLTNPIKFTVTFDSTGKPVDIPTLVDDYAQEYASVLTKDVSKFRTNYTANIRVYNMPERVYLAINKYDWLTNNPIQDVEFKVTVEENGTSRDINSVLTNAQGNAVVQIDTFKEEAQGRSVIYTIHEVAAPDSYRKTQDLKIEVLYDAKGGISSWQVLSNESNLNYTVYRRGNTSIQKIENVYAHMKVSIPNDNTYDLIVKDEDINYKGLGVQGTKYDITINGIPKNAATTSSTGYTQLKNLTDNGNFQIRIAEKTIGEGYRENKENDIILEIEKAATGAYSLSLNTSLMTNYTITETANSTTSVPEYRIDLTDNTYAIVSVSEEYGQIKVTFFNETKSELTLIKQDINSKASLQDVEFKITKKDLAKNEETVLTQNTKTDANGRIYFDLGIAPQNTTVEYTFEELSQPKPTDKYQTVLLPQTVTVTYDIYGRITNIITNSRLRTKAFLQHSDNNNCRSVITTIGNGTLDPQYKVKVVTEDVDTGRRINGSTIDVEVKNISGDTLTQLPLNNPQNPDRSLPNITQNLCTDGKLHTDTEVEQEGYRVIEKGVIITEGIKQKGEITIDVSQTGFAYGYEKGSQKVTGQVKIATDFKDNPNGSLDSLLTMELKNNDGLEVTVDEDSREIIITIKNESRVGLTLEKLSTIVNEDGSRDKIKGASFTVTSKILTASSEIATDLKVDTRLTGVDGITSESIGKAYPGKTVVYTIHENELEGYVPIEDIEIAVVFDLKGNISYVELLSAYIDILNWEDIVNSFNGTKDIRIPILNTPIIQDYQVILEKHDIDDGLYPDLIPGAEYEITVAEQFGETKTWTAITNSEGKIYSTYFSGYGTINITIREITAPVGYELDPLPKYITLFRNKDSGVIQKYSSDVNIDVNDENTIVALKPLDKGMNNTYGLIIDKVDVDTGLKIIKDTAQFEVTITKQETKEDDNYEEPTTPEVDEGIDVDTEVNEPIENENTQAETNTDIDTDTPTDTGEETDTNNENSETSETVVTYKETLEPMTTSNGRAMIRTVYAPEEAGIYTYTIKEIKVPDGYTKDPQEVVFEVEFEKTPEGNMIIKNARKISGEYASILALREDTLGFTLGNKDTSLIPKEDEYLLNIYKVDENKELITESTAMFMIVLPDGSKQYVETENGKLKLEHFKLPEEAGTITYKIKEIMAPEGYVLDREEKTLEITFIEKDGKIVIKEATVEGTNISITSNDEKVININVVNKEGKTPIDPPVEDAGKYTLIINKLDSESKEHITKAKFIVTLEDGQKLEVETDENGQAIIRDVKVPVKPGTYPYVIKEISAPNGYKLDSTYKVIEITFIEQNDEIVIGVVSAVSGNNVTANLLENDVVSVDILNEKEGKPVDPDDPDKDKVDVTIKKYEEGTTTGLKGAVIAVYDKEGNEVTRVTTNDNGEATFKLKAGTYKYKEVTAPDGYKLNDTMYTFTIGKDGEVVFDSANGIIYNKKEEDKPVNPDDPDKDKVDVTIKKYEEGTTTGLKGAVIAVYDKEGNEVTRVTTNDNGEATFKLKAGTYKYKEVTAPDGYKLNDTMYTFTIGEDGKVVFDSANGIIYNTKNTTKPTDPDDPNKPTDPDDPNKPTDPDDPNKPTDPDDPNKPTNPDDPNKPEDKVFDLSSEKYITNVTIKYNDTNETIKKTNLDRDGITKLDVKANRLKYLELTLEYKIVVTNVGNKAGTLNSIVDRVPNGLYMNISENKGWSLYNNVATYMMPNTILQPGESKEVTIVLHYNGKTQTTGKIINYASFEADGEIDGDHIENTNNLAKAVFVLSIKTGQEIIIYPLLTFSALVVLGLGVAGIKKYVL